MKKNKALRAASALLVLTLLTTSIIGGTFAKYTTSDSATDTARVAKFGVLVTVSGSLFADSYKEEPVTDNSATVIAYNRSAAADGDDVVAPGTENDTGITFGLSGTPEVSTEVKYEVVDTTEDSKDYSNIWLADGEYGVMVEVQDTTGEQVQGYYTQTTGGSGTVNTYTYISTDTIGAAGIKYYKYEPIVKLDSTSYTANDGRYVPGKYYPIIWEHKIGNAADATEVHSLSDLDTAIEKIQSTYDPNTDLGIVKNSDVVIAWKWPFEVTGNSVVDSCDTVLGNLIAGTEVVKMDTGNAVTVIKTETVDDVTTAKAGTDTVACLTAAYNIALTVEQVD